VRERERESERERGGTMRPSRVLDGVSVDKVEAIKWYKLAAAQGHVRAQCVLGALYFKGDGVSINKL